MTDEDIKFVQEVAKEYGHVISESEAKEIDQIVKNRCTCPDDYYYVLKEYMLN